MRLDSGTRLGPYEIVAPIGAGGMGEVYRARDPRLGREIAIKVLPAAVATEPDRLRRFQHEARTVASFSHPNIVVLHSVEDADGIPFLTMELVQGRSLREVMKPGGLPLLEVLDVAIPLADALAAAHQRQVVHRDLKPANVMLTAEGHVKVLDFGLAKLVGSDPGESQAMTLTSPHSDAGSVAGTVGYMSPEQIRGQTIDGRTDLFALGILLYELLTGRPPFKGRTLMDVSGAILHDSPPPLQTMRPELPSDVSRIVARCLEKNPELRFQTAKDVRNELRLVRQATESNPSHAPGSGGAPVPAPPEEGTIAVLPFVSQGRAVDDDYFADGITEDVIAQLSKVRTLTVISLASAAAFRSPDVDLRDVAARLRVAHLLTGTIRRAGDRVRIVTQLIDAASGRTLWSETFDRQLTDIFAVSSDVAMHIAGALEAELSPEERRRIQRKPTEDAQAYEHYLRGRYCFLRFNAEEMLKSIEHYRRALARDPKFALAWVGLALSHTELGDHGRYTREQGGMEATSAAARAIELAPDLAEAHCALAHARQVFSHDWVGAEQSYRKALELNPNDSHALDLYGRLCAGLGRFDEAIALQERAYQVDPLTHRTDVANSLLRAGRLEEAERAIRRALDHDPDDARCYATLGWIRIRGNRMKEGLADLERGVALDPGEDMWTAQLAEAYGLAGRTDEARALLRRLEDPARPRRASPYHLAYAYTGLGEHERALDLLEEAQRTGIGPVATIGGSYLFSPLRGHPRFRALLERMNVPPTG